MVNWKSFSYIVGLFLVTVKSFGVSCIFFSPLYLFKVIYTFWSHIEFLGLQEPLLLPFLSGHLFKAIKTRFPGIFCTLP